MMTYQDYVDAEIAQGDSIVETGSNRAGEYTKLASGKLIMKGNQAVLPCQSVVAPVMKDQSTCTGSWK